MQDSLGKRFVLLLTVSMLCLVGLVASQVYYERNTSALNDQRTLLSTLSEQLLRLRIEQKTFLNQRDAGTIDEVNQLVAELSSLLQELYPLMRQYQLPTAQMEAIESGFQQYKNKLNSIIEISIQIGLDEKSGLRGKFRQAVRRLEANSILLDDESLQIALLQMRRNEKDFMERKKADYVAHQLQWAGQIEATINKSAKLKGQDLLPLLIEYQTEFDQLVHLYDQLGLTSSDGVLQEFQSHSEQMNELILKVSHDLEDTLNEASSYLKNLGLFLVIASTGLLFIIVLNSFITLRKGLKGFLSFFEASKTSEAPVCFADLKFSEFHEVALMAQQMVRAREQVEEHLRETSEALEQANAELTRAATLDGLTGIANRRRLDEVLNREWHRCQRDKTPLGVILMDIDHFKLYNDTYGHQAGDETLITVAKLLDTTTERATDLTARYGGEEFAVVLPNTALEGARLIGQKMVDAVAAKGLPHDSSPTSSVVTLSAGVFATVPEGDISPEKWFTFADQALYNAKSGGRSRVCVWGATSDNPDNGENEISYTYREKSE